jgi:hypothetical protein
VCNPCGPKRAFFVSQGPKQLVRVCCGCFNLLAEGSGTNPGSAGAPTDGGSGSVTSAPLKAAGEANASLPPVGLMRSDSARNIALPDGKHTQTHMRISSSGLETWGGSLGKAPGWSGSARDGEGERSFAILPSVEGFSLDPFQGLFSQPFVRGVPLGRSNSLLAELGAESEPDGLHEVFIIITITIIVSTASSGHRGSSTSAGHVRRDCPGRRLGKRGAG